MTGGSGAGGVEVWGCRSPILFSFILFLTPYFAYPQPGQLICAWSRDKARAGQICPALGGGRGRRGGSSTFLGNDPQLNKCSSVEITPTPAPGLWRQTTCCQLEVKLPNSHVGVSWLCQWQGVGGMRPEACERSLLVPSICPTPAGVCQTRVGPVTSVFSP